MKKKGKMVQLDRPTKEIHIWLNKGDWKKPVQIEEVVQDKFNRTYITVRE